MLPLLLHKTPIIIGYNNAFIWEPRGIVAVWKLPILRASAVCALLRLGPLGSNRSFYVCVSTRKGTTLPNVIPAPKSLLLPGAPYICTQVPYLRRTTPTTQKARPPPTKDHGTLKDINHTPTSPILLSLLCVRGCKMATGYCDAPADQSYLMATDMNAGMYDGTSSESSASSPMNCNVNATGINPFEQMLIYKGL